MKSLNLYLHNIIEVQEFLNVANEIEGEVTLSDGQHTVNAKSAIGIFCLDFSKQLELVIRNWKDKYISIFERLQV